MVEALVLGMVAQSSLLLSGLLVYWVRIPTKVVGVLAGFGAGALISAIAFDLIPEAELLGPWQLVLWMLLGAAVLLAGDAIVERRFGDEGAGGAMGIVVGSVVDGVPESLIFGIQIAAGSAVSAGFLAAVLVSNVRRRSRPRRISPMPAGAPDAPPGSGWRSSRAAGSRLRSGGWAPPRSRGERRSRRGAGGGRAPGDADQLPDAVCLRARRRTGRGRHGHRLLPRDRGPVEARRLGGRRSRAPRTAAHRVTSGAATPSTGRREESLTAAMNIVADNSAGEIGMDSELGILSWIIFGTLAGWVATMIAGIAQEHGWDDAELENIIVGIFGAFVGGFLFGLLTGRETPFAWNIGSFIAAVIGAVVLLVILHLVRRARSNPLP